MEWYTGQAAHVKGEINHCSFDGKTCYKAKTVPVINSISSNEGYTTGGQSLTIKGHGFDSNTV